MKTASARIILFSLLASSSSIACAQSISIPAPATRSPIDENGVNLATGSISVTDPGVAIGPEGTALAHTRRWVGAGWRHSFFLTVSTTATTATVSIGGQSNKFNLSGGVYTSDNANGTTLTATASAFTYTLADGTVFTFSRTLVNNNRSYYGTVAAVGTLVVLPNRERITLTYKQGSYVFNSITVYTIRLQSVNSNSGLQLKYGYVSNSLSSTTVDNWYRIGDVRGINNIVDYCAPAADTCSGMTQSWPSVSYARISGGNYWSETVTDALGRARTFVADASNRLTDVKPPSDLGKMAFTYDANSRVASATRTGTTEYNESSSTTIYTRNYAWSVANNILTSVGTDALGRTRTVTASTLTQNILTDTDALNRTTTFTYDASGRLFETIAPEGNKVQHLYDARGNITTKTAVAKPGSGWANIVAQARFPATCTNVKICNKPYETLNSRSELTSYTYDATHGGVTKIVVANTAAGDRETRFAYSTFSGQSKNAAGTIVDNANPIYRVTSISTCASGTPATCVNTVNETRQTFGYGASGELQKLAPKTVSITSGTGSVSSTTAVTYDAVGNVLTSDGPLAGTADTTLYRYDAARQVVGVVSPDPDGAGALKNRAVRTTYDNDGRAALVESGTVNSQSNSDWAGFSVLTRSKNTYDDFGRIKSSGLIDLSAAGPFGGYHDLTTYCYDGANRLTTTQQYMVRLNPVDEFLICSFHGRNTSIQYNGADERTQVTSSVASTSYTYTSNGKVLTLKDGKNNLTTYEYDPFDQVAKVRYPAPGTPNTSSTTDFERFEYDTAGYPTFQYRRDGTYTSTPTDSEGRVLRINRSNGEPTTNFTYDLMGRTLSVWTTAATNSFTYDALGRVINATSPQGTFGYQYDSAGRRITMTWPDALQINYDYLVTGEVSHIRENGATSGIGVLGTYAYDDFGRRTSLTRGNGVVTTYSFDPASRLTSLADNLAGTAADTTTTMTYNPAGQIATRARSNDSYVWTDAVSVNRAYAANGLNQYNLIAGTIVPTYDARGNLTGTGQSTYGYNIDNQLVSSSSPAATLSYDPLGRLYRTTGGSTTRFAYDGSNLVGEYSDSNVLQRRYVHGPGTDEPLVWYEGSGTSDRRWLQADERGSIVSVSDGSGSSIGINTYDEYGLPKSANPGSSNPGNANIGRFQYTGQMWLPELGMYHFKARVYSPTLGRFLQPDPIGYGDGMNMYAYAGGDPINRRDPSGTCSVGDFIAVCYSPRLDFFYLPDFLRFHYQPSFYFPNIPSFGNGNLTPPASDPNNCDSPTGEGCIVVTGTRQKTTIESTHLGVGRVDIGFTPVVLGAAAGAGAAPQKVCPAIPSVGPGKGTLDKNIRDARNARAPSYRRGESQNGGLKNLIGQSYRVVTDQNYKADPRYGDPGARFGNFNFGATFQARGFTLEETLGYSNTFQKLTTFRSDPAEDIADVTNGYNYAARGC